MHFQLFSINAHAQARTPRSRTSGSSERRICKKKKKKKFKNGAFNSRPPVRKRGGKDWVRCRACACAAGVRDARLGRARVYVRLEEGQYERMQRGNRDWPVESSSDRLADFARACGFACTCSVAYSAIWYVRLFFLLLYSSSGAAYFMYTTAHCGTAGSSARSFVLL